MEMGHGREGTLLLLLPCLRRGCLFKLLILGFFVTIFCTGKVFSKEDEEQTFGVPTAPLCISECSTCPVICSSPPPPSPVTSKPPPFIYFSSPQSPKPHPPPPPEPPFPRSPPSPSPPASPSPPPPSSSHISRKTPPPPPPENENIPSPPAPPSMSGSRNYSYPYYYFYASKAAPISVLTCISSFSPLVIVYLSLM